MQAGTILHVCLSPRKGIAKTAVATATLIAERGMEGDVHAGDWHRQLSLLDEAEIETMRVKGLDLAPGAFGENLVIRGLELGDLGIGSRLRAGDVELEITQIGKVCHSRCAIYDRVGDCIMPRAGIFARVLRAGEIAPGLPIEIAELVPRSAIQVGVLTVSDSRAAGRAEDTTGPAVARLVSDRLGAHVAWSGVVADEAGDISDTLRNLAERNLDLAITAGGTGFGPRDVTPEATRAVIDREAPGLAEAMRAASLAVTSHAMLQRGVCGIRGAMLIVNLPGSEKAAVENLTEILAALPHAVRLLRGEMVH